MTIQKQKLMEAEKMASLLFKAVEDRRLIMAGKTESELNEEIFRLAD